MCSTKHWQGCAEGRRLGAMSGVAPASRTNKKTIRILGVDPAAAGPTGYGIVESDGRNCRMLHYGALTVAAKRRKECLGATLQDVHALLCRLIEEFARDAMAVESVFTALNMRTALRLAEMRGVVLLAAAQAQIPAHSYSPREVKSCVAGYGAASKQQMQQMVCSQLGLSSSPEPADAADALAVALCHAHLSQARDRIAAATGISRAIAVERIRTRAARV